MNTSMKYLLPTFSHRNELIILRIKILLNSNFILNNEKQTVILLFLIYIYC